LREVLESECRRVGASLRFDSVFRGYTVLAVAAKR
jgi:S-adenosylmethionine-diacylgycerolhomoserine-N-methlytransferase